MRAALALLALLAGCDFAAESGPAWTEVGAVATFDYAPGPDSLFALGAGFAPPYARAASAARAVEMRVAASGDWRRTDRHVEWADPGETGGSRFEGEVRLPLDDDDVDVTDDGLRVTTAYQCVGNGWFGGSSGSVAFVRVPRTTGRIQTYTSCSNGPGALLEAARIETVTVPAGTFEAVVIEAFDQTEWWSWEAGLVRLDVVNDEGALRGRFVRSAGP